MTKRQKLALGLGVSLLALTPVVAHANPQDPAVQAGSVSFDENGNTLNVYQSTDRAIIDWRSFNIDTGEVTQFYQPSSGSFTLNRVRSNDPSTINGMLSANGTIAIINPNGVYFGGGAQIDVGGLIATTSDIDNNDFMNGAMNFNIPGQAGAKIVNDGHITAREGGLIGLVAPSVENNGIIEARLGKVQLKSGDTFTLDMAGDGLINVAVSEDQARQVINNGQIHADGGAVALSVADARATVDSLIVNKGTIAANSVGIKNGKIVLSAGGSNKTAKTGTATVLNEGAIEAKGTQSGETGGSVHLLGDHVGVMKNSAIDVSGASGGGEILLGGEYQGSGTIQTAQRTYVDSRASMNARAEEEGDGGRVIVWADDVTRYYGDINVSGGDVSGDGGLIEVSGKNYLDFAGTISADAVNGETGTLLLDPTDITISNAVDNNVNGASPFSPTIDDGPSNLNITTLLGALAGANVTVQTRATGSQPGNITVVDPLSWTDNRQLTLTAHNKVIFDAPVTARNALIVNAADVDINAALAEAAGGGTLYLRQRTSGTSVGIAGGAGSFNLSNADLDFIQPGWNSVQIGVSSGTATMDIGARTWNAPTYFYSRTGEIQVNGAQDFGAFNGAFITRNLSINNTVTGTGALSIYADNNAISMGLAGAAGTLNVDATELDRIADGWSALTFGRTSATADLLMNAYTWRDTANFRVGNATIQVDGVQDSGGNDMSFYGRNLALNADVTGTGTLTITPDGNRTIGINGGAGLMQIDSAMLNHFTGWDTLRFGSTSLTQNIDVGATNWNSSAEFLTHTGAVIINGDQQFATGKNLLIRSNADPVINGDLIGDGSITLGNTSTATIGLAGGAGTFNLSAAELDHIADGWNDIFIGITGVDRAITANAYVWRDNVTFQSDNGVITINGAQDVGANNFTLRSDANPVINAPIRGSGTLLLATEATNTTIGLAGAGGTFNLNAADLNNIADGWSQIVIGQDNGTGSITANAYTWNDPLHLQRSTGAVTISGAQNMAANDLTITADSIAVNGALNGTGTLILKQGSSNRSMGLAGGSGSFNLTAAELNRFTDGWSQIILGRNDSTATVNINPYTWSDNVTIRGGSGQMRFIGAQDFGANTTRIETDNLRIDQDLSGTGDLVIAPSDVTTSIGLAGGAGALNLTAAELGHLADGWNSITIGRSDGTGAVTLNGYTNWMDPIRIMKDGSDTANAFTITALQSNAALSNGSLRFDGNVNLDADITTDDTDIVFGGPVTLGANRALDAGAGNIAFLGAVDGAFDLDIDALGDVSFNSNVGSGSRLADVTITGAHDITADGNFAVNSLVIDGATGLANFAAADATTDIDIEAVGIQGAYTAPEILMDSGSGTINAHISAHALDIDGAGATLLAGYIGTPGQATQDMANLIKINGALMPTPNSAFTFSGYTIGEQPLPEDFVLNTLRQSYVPLQTSNNLSLGMNFGPGPLPEDGVFAGTDFASHYPVVIRGLVYADPALSGLWIEY